eukprot:SAG22_NODE_443_length_10453_cov_8.799691_5_plen_326_part_00
MHSQSDDADSDPPSRPLQLRAGSGSGGRPAALTPDRLHRAARRRVRPAAAPEDSEQVFSVPTLECRPRCRRRLRCGGRAAVLRNQDATGAAPGAAARDAAAAAARAAGPRPAEAVRLHAHKVLQRHPGLGRRLPGVLRRAQSAAGGCRVHAARLHRVLQRQAAGTAAAAAAAAGVPVRRGAGEVLQRKCCQLVLRLHHLLRSARGAAQGGRVHDGQLYAVVQGALSGAAVAAAAAARDDAVLPGLLCHRRVFVRRMGLHWKHRCDPVHQGGVCRVLPRSPWPPHRGAVHVLRHQQGQPEVLRPTNLAAEMWLVNCWVLMTLGERD